MFLRILAGAAILMTSAGPALAADRETVLAPSMPWNMDGTPSGCALRRTFGTGNPPLLLEMRRFGHSKSFELSVSGFELAGLSPLTNLRVSYGSLPHHDEPIPFLKGQSERGGVPNIPSFIAGSQLDASSKDDDLTDLSWSGSPELEARATDVTLQWGSKKLVLKTGPLDKAFAALRQCTDALVESWGLDLKVERTLSRQLEAIDPKSWPAKFDFPASSYDKGKQARVNVRLLVDATGKPTDCAIPKSYNDPTFDTVACKTLLRIARFKPALDSNGIPVRSAYVTTIIWKWN